ncbi:MAG TPA: hypothetical protein VFN88_00950 [Caulobacteraceae bacterium]|nr:hypothetical protein [Caulobacteraceae bacterium]
MASIGLRLGIAIHGVLFASDMSSPEKKPEIIELERYRKAAHARAAQQAAKASRKAPPERVLGSRRHAGWLLLLVILVVAALTIAPRFLRF